MLPAGMEGDAAAEDGLRTVLRIVVKKGAAL